MGSKAALDFQSSAQATNNYNTFAADDPPPAYDQYTTVRPVTRNVDDFSKNNSNIPTVSGNTDGTNIPMVGPESSSIVCPSCHYQIYTRVDHTASTKTHLFGLMCMLVCWPMAWVPYLVDSCKNANHYCPNCSAFVGVYKP